MNESAEFRYFCYLWDRSSPYAKFKVWAILQLAALMQNLLARYNQQHAVFFLTADVSDNDTYAKEDDQQLTT